MIIYECDVCKKSCEKEELLKFKIFPRSFSTKLKDKSIGSKDICKACYRKIFIKDGGKKNG